jgi:hypothetical protein
MSNLNLKYIKWGLSAVYRFNSGMSEKTSPVSDCWRRGSWDPARGSPIETAADRTAIGKSGSRSGLVADSLIWSRALWGTVRGCSDWFRNSPRVFGLIRTDLDHFSEIVFIWVYDFMDISLKKNWLGVSHYLPVLLNAYLVPICHLCNYWGHCKLFEQTFVRDNMLMVHLKRYHLAEFHCLLLLNSQSIRVVN